MSSQRKINTARTNGARSHGLKTQEGLEKSAMNAVTYGLYTASVVIQGEAREKYQEILDAYIRQFQPDGPAESDLIEEMVAAKWRQRRLWAIETDLLEDEMIVQAKKLDADGETYDQLIPLSFAYRELSTSLLSFLTRHESRLERVYSRALKTLLDLQRLRNRAAQATQQNMQERTQSQTQTPPLNQPQPTLGPSAGLSTVMRDATPPATSPVEHPTPRSESPRPALPAEPRVGRSSPDSRCRPSMSQHFRRFPSRSALESSIPASQTECLAGCWSDGTERNKTSKDMCLAPAQ